MTSSEEGEVFMDPPCAEFKDGERICYCGVCEFSHIFLKVINFKIALALWCFGFYFLVSLLLVDLEILIFKFGLQIMALILTPIVGVLTLRILGELVYRLKRKQD